MTDTTKTEALRLADWLQAAVQTYPQMSEDEPGGYCTEVDQVMDEAATELRRLSAVESERDRLAAECEALRAAVLPALQTGLETALELLAQKGEAYGGDSQYVATYKDAVQELRGAITAAMGGKESQGGNGSWQEGK